MTMKIGEQIKRLRKRKGISQEALAEILGVSFQAVSKWETTSTMPDISLVPSIAAFFDVSIDELFDYNVLENEMLLIMSREYERQEKTADALSCRRIAESILRLYQQENGQRYEVSGYEWIDVMPAD